MNCYFNRQLFERFPRFFSPHITIRKTTANVFLLLCYLFFFVKTTSEKQWNSDKIFPPSSVCFFFFFYTISSLFSNIKRKRKGNASSMPSRLDVIWFLSYLCVASRYSTHIRSSSFVPVIRLLRFSFSLSLPKLRFVSHQLCTFGCSLFFYFLFNRKTKTSNDPNASLPPPFIWIERLELQKDKKITDQKDSLMCFLSSLSTHSRCVNMYLYDPIGHRSTLHRLISFVMLGLRTRMIQPVWMKAKISIRWGLSLFSSSVCSGQKDVLGMKVEENELLCSLHQRLSLIHIWRCRRRG